jgi:hypothetical protein
MEIELSVEGVPGVEIEKVGGGSITIEPNNLTEGVYFITVPEENLAGMQTPLKVTVYGNGTEVETKNIKFLGPANLN